MRLLIQENGLCITVGLLSGKTQRLHITFLRWEMYKIIQDLKDGSRED